MAQVPIQRFQPGDVVWLADGRSFVVVEVRLGPQGATWTYRLAGVPTFIPDFALFASDPTADDEPPSDVVPPPVVVPAPTGLSAAAVQVMIDASLAAAVTGLIAAIQATGDLAVDRAEAAVNPRIEALSNSIIRNVTQLTEIENRVQEQEGVANESGDGGVLGFLRRAGGFVSAPFTSLLDTVSGFILTEVRDGLNR